MALLKTQTRRQPRSAQYANKRAAFTLVELMITIVVISVLTAISLPVYIDQQFKARRTCAQSQVAALAREQQVYYSENSRFASDYTALGTNAPAACNGYRTATLSQAVIDASPIDSSKGYCVRATLTQGSYSLNWFKGLCGAG